MFAPKQDAIYTYTYITGLMFNPNAFGVFLRLGVGGSIKHDQEYMASNNGGQSGFKPHLNESEVVQGSANR